MSDVVGKLLGGQVDWNSVSLDSRIYHSFFSAELEYHRFSVVREIFDESGYGWRSCRSGPRSYRRS